MSIKIDSKNLVTKYSDMIYHIALSYLKNKDDAEDIVQEVFMNYINFIKTNNDFESENHEKFWIIRVTINLCNNELKSKRKRNKVILNNEIFKTFDFNENEICLIDCIDKLKDNYKIVFELFYIKELKISEISAILNISESNVKTRLKRARDKLKKILQSGGERKSEEFR